MLFAHKENALRPHGKCSLPRRKMVFAHKENALCPQGKYSTQERNADLLGGILYHGPGSRVVLLVPHLAGLIGRVNGQNQPIRGKAPMGGCQQSLSLWSIWCSCYDDLRTMGERVWYCKGRTI